jgi:hypothetical protein
MDIKIQKPPRVFSVGKNKEIQVKDCASIYLEPNEQVTFKTFQGGEYDVAMKEWGFYATPSLNGRLASFGLRAVLIKSFERKFYIFMVEKGREDLFEAYLKKERHCIVTWLDTDKALTRLEKKIGCP